MANPDDSTGGLPDVLRNANRPIVIYQGAPPPNEFQQVNSALGVLLWLALVTVCLVVAGAYAWKVWGGGHDRAHFSPIYAEGRPMGLMKQVEERREINGVAEGLNEFRDAIHADNLNGRITAETHRLITDAQGIDTLRRRWDALCEAVSARIFERRVGELDARAAALRQERTRAADPAELARIEGELLRLRAERNERYQQMRSGADPTLSCTPAAQARVCSGQQSEAWCNPQLERPDEFRSDGR
jgi:hypothetical protein